VDVLQESREISEAIFLHHFIQSAKALGIADLRADTTMISSERKPPAVEADLVPARRHEELFLTNEVVIRARVCKWKMAR